MTEAEVTRRLGLKRPLASRPLAGKVAVPNLGPVADVAEALDVYVDGRIPGRAVAHRRIGFLPEANPTAAHSE